MEKSPNKYKKQENPMTDIEAIRIEMINEATNAANELFKKYGSDHVGSRGVAWTTIYPEHKGNTKLGKAERAIFKELGFEKDSSGKTYQMWNPSNYLGKNINIKEAGAVAAANTLKRYKFNASGGSRLKE